ncbi:GxxExxY protein [Chitinophagaceae bacterium LWZ2-11]
MVPIFYDDLYIEDAYRLDVLAEENVILEIKCVEHIIPVHFKQLTTYLKLAELKNGILLNFKTNLMKEGIYRVFNNQGECRQSYLDKK